MHFAPIRRIKHVQMLRMDILPADAIDLHLEPITETPSSSVAVSGHLLNVSNPWIRRIARRSDLPPRAASSSHRGVASAPQGPPPETLAQRVPEAPHGDFREPSTVEMAKPVSAYTICRLDTKLAQIAALSVKVAEE